MVASLVAEQAPALIDKLVLIGFMYSRMSPLVSQSLTPQAWDAITSVPHGYMPPRPDLKRASLPCATPEIVEWNIAISSYDVPNAPLLSVKNLPLVKNPAQITAPVLIINGAHEIFATESDSR